MAKHRIMVVDDEEAVRHVLRNLFEQKGCEVTVAGSAEEAFELLQAAPPAVALVDIVLPGKSGIDLLREIMHLSPETEVIMITSFGSPGTYGEAIRLGAVAYLEKPFESLLEVWNNVYKALVMRLGDDFSDGDVEDVIDDDIVGGMKTSSGRGR